MRTKAQRPKNDRSRAVLRATTGVSEARVVRKRSRRRPFPDGVSGNGTILREETEALQASIQRATAQAERQRGLGLVPSPTPQGVHHGLLLDLGEGLRRGGGAGNARCPEGKTRRRRGMSADAEMGGGDDVALGGNQRALDGVLKLADVARPGVSE